MFIFESERKCEWGRGTERGESENPKQALHYQAEVGLKRMNGEIMTWAEVERLGSWATQVPLFVIFWGTSILFHSGCPDLHPNNLQQCTGFPFLHILTSPCYLFLLIIAIWWGWSDTSLWFWFAFPWWVTLSILSRVCWPSGCHLWKNCLFRPSACF